MADPYAGMTPEQAMQHYQYMQQQYMMQQAQYQQYTQMQQHPQMDYTNFFQQQFGGFSGDDGHRSSHISDSRPSTTLWLGQVAPSVPEFELRKIFSHFGDLDSVKTVPHRSCAFIKYFDLESATAAYESFQREPLVLAGQMIRVGWGKTDARSERRGDSDQTEPSNTLWVGGVDARATEDDLRDIFKPYGHVERIKMVSHKNCAFVIFSNVDAAAEAKSRLYGVSYRGVPLKINFKKNDDRGHSPSRRQEMSHHISQPPAPTDDRIKTIIHKIAENVIEVGPALEDYFVEMQRFNPKFAFLIEGGEGNEYYKWRLYHVRHQQSLEKNPWDEDANPWDEKPEPTVGAPVEADEEEEPLTPAQVMMVEDRAAFISILENLQPKNESIAFAKDWIINRVTKVRDIMRSMLQHMQSAESGKTQLTCLYLLNDVLINVPTVGQSLKKEVGMLMNVAWHNPNGDKAKIEGLLTVWRNKEVFDDAFLGDLDSAMRSAVRRKRKREEISE